MNLTLMPENVDPANVIITFDGDSDTLLIHFYGRGIPGVSVAAGEDAMLCLDRERKRVIGVHIEHFLRIYAVKHPETLDLLDLAELRSISDEELTKVRREIAARHKDALVRRVVTGLGLSTSAAD